VRPNSGFAQLPNGLFVPRANWVDEQERAGIPRRVAIANAIRATLANDSVTVTPGAGATVATHLAGGKEHQVVMVADESGHLQQTLPTYTWWVPGAAVGASKLYADVFNAAGSGKILELRGLWAIPKSDVAVTGVVAVEVGLYRTSAVGTGGTAHTYNGGSASTAHVITPWDTSNAALPAQVTARSLPAGGATISALYWAQYVFTEETNAATYVSAFTNLLPVGTMNQRLTFNEGQGLLIRQGTVAGVGSLAFLGLFTLV